MHHLIERLVEFHHGKASSMSAMRSLLADVQKSDQQARQELGRLLALFRDDDERAHHHNEELILLELQRHHQPVHPQIAGISEEHSVFSGMTGRLLDAIYEPLTEVSVLVSDVDWFIVEYDNHATVEETILFPTADQNLSGRAWGRVGKQWLGDC